MWCRQSQQEQSHQGDEIDLVGCLRCWSLPNHSNNVSHSDLMFNPILNRIRCRLVRWLWAPCALKVKKCNTNESAWTLFSPPPPSQSLHAVSCSNWTKAAQGRNQVDGWHFWLLSTRLSFFGHNLQTQYDQPPVSRRWHHTDNTACGYNII